MPFRWVSLHSYSLNELPLMMDGLAITSAMLFCRKLFLVLHGLFEPTITVMVKIVEDVRKR
jgi:hypothetical protein